MNVRTVSLNSQHLSVRMAFSVVVAVLVCSMSEACSVCLGGEQDSEKGVATLGVHENDVASENWEYPEIDSLNIVPSSLPQSSNEENSDSDLLSRENAPVEEDCPDTKDGQNSSDAFNLKRLFDSENGLLGPGGISTSVKVFLATSVLSLAPALLLMTTSYIRISVVLSLLRQALGAGQVPSNQVVAGLAIFMTILIMTPVWSDVYTDAITPYANGDISGVEALEIGQAPVRTFLWRQIEHSGNSEVIGVFTQYIPDATEPKYYEDIPWRALAPAFVLSELKTAFLIGFQILLPFLIIDVVVSCVLVSTGMMMLPPAIVSLPFKLALFVLVDGWTLVVKSLLASFTWGIDL